MPIERALEVVRDRKAQLSTDQLHRTLALVYMNAGDLQSSRQIIGRWTFSPSNIASDHLNYLLVLARWVRKSLEANVPPFSILGDIENLLRGLSNTAKQSQDLS
jgi:hypothetical protein